MNYPEIPALHLDGVCYAILNSHSQQWRMGSIITQWQEELARLGSQPEEQMLRQAAINGVWLKKEQKNGPIAVMCGGMGAAWPHMGRELYDNFPACRNAMDFLAGQTDWDLLGLMDEPDVEIINQTRLQIPYLFMLEYAQWSQLVSLGFKPDLICGHSLGELLALCFAGVYSPTSAWYLLNIRAAHIAELESRVSTQEGMLAVAGDFDFIKEALAQHPEIKIANRNTPSQYILGGPLDSLMLVRKILRKKRIPAFKLNMNIAFHNPAMRILRELSLRRLNALDMIAPKIPMLSCVTARRYPDEKKEICKFIVDLDENTVDWPSCVNVMLENYQIQTFLELGPQDILCSLTKENILDKNLEENNIDFIPADRKGREKEAMREACARLFANGYLDWNAIKNKSQINYSIEKAYSKNNEIKSINSNKTAESGDLSSNPAVKAVLEVLSEISQFPIEQITYDMDLRHDLGLRSSRFPYIVQLAEHKLGKTFNLDRLLQVITVGDLINFFSDNLSHPPNLQKIVTNPDKKYYDFNSPNPPLERYKFENGKFLADPLNPLKNNRFNSNDIIIVCNLDKEMQKDIISALTNFNIKIALPENDLEDCKKIEKTETQILSYPINTYASESLPDPREIENVLKDFIAKHSCVHALIFVLPCHKIEYPDEKFLQEYFSILYNLPIPFKLFFQRFKAEKETNYKFQLNCIEQTFENIFNSTQNTDKCGLKNTRFVGFLDDRKNRILENPYEIGDLLALEIYCGKSQKVIWTRYHKQTDGEGFSKENNMSAKYDATSSIFQKIIPENLGLSNDGPGVFEATTQYSLFSLPDLNNNSKTHFQNAEFSPLNWFAYEKPFNKSPWLFLSSIFERILIASKVLYPWLEPVGFSDIRFFSIPGLPSGNTRQVRIMLNSRPSLMYDDIMTHMCNFKMSLRRLEANGRGTDHTDPLAAGLVLLCNSDHFLSRAKPLIKPVWKNPEKDFNLTDNNLVNYDNSEFIIKDNLIEFYKTLNINDTHKFIKDCKLNPIKFNKHNDILTLPPDSFFKLNIPNIAKQENWDYKFDAEYKNIFLDACFEAALFRIADLIYYDWDSENLLKNNISNKLMDKKDIAAILNSWRLHSIGYMRFLNLTNYIHFYDLKISLLKDINLWLRLSWKDSHIIRFDCQVNIDLDLPVLTIHHLEFENISHN